MADTTKDSFAFEAPSSTSIPHPPPPKTNLSSMATHYILRFLAILLSASSIAVMVTNNQTVTIFSFQFQAHYYYSSSLKFLVATNAIICAFSFLSLIAAFLLLRRRGPPSSSQSQPRCIFFILFLHDLVMTVVMISGCAAATAIGYVGKYGEEHVGWVAICDRVPKFCKTNTVSICLSYLAFFTYLVLTILMAYKLMMSSSPPNK